MNNIEVSKSNATNGKAIASLILGILSILIPFIGLVFALIGLVLSRIATREIVKTNEDGKGLATAGLICSIVGVVFQAFMVIGLLSFYAITTEQVQAITGLVLFI